MHDTFVSFYQKLGHVRVSKKALCSLGNPLYIRFLLSRDGKSMIMQPYNRKVFQSMRVPKELYGEPVSNARMEICCIPFTRMIRNHMGWDQNLSYRVPGKVYPAQKIVKFDLTKSTVITVQPTEV